MITQVYNCFTLSASQALVLNLLVELTQLLSDTDDNERKNKKINKPVIGADPSTRKGTIIFKLFKILNLFFNFLIFFNFMYILHLNFFFLNFGETASLNAQREYLSKVCTYGTQC